MAKPKSNFTRPKMDQNHLKIGKHQLNIIKQIPKVIFCLKRWLRPSHKQDGNRFSIKDSLFTQPAILLH